jgi:hypothetical protein
MIEKYFKDFDKSILKRSKTATSAPLKKGDKKSGTKAAIDIQMLKEALARIIPSQLTIDAAHPIDSAGFSPEGVDLVVYKRYCSDIKKLMDGYIPCELIYGLFHVIQNLNKESLPDFLNTIATAKKINNFIIGQEETQKGLIPSFGIVANTNYQFHELKNDIINYYLSKNLEYQYEIDILMIFRQGIIVKNWREKRSFVALETKEDTNLWFYILMNEYLDLNNEAPIDFRKYIKKEVIYNEY